MGSGETTREWRISSDKPAFPVAICLQRVPWRFAARRARRSGSTGDDHLPNKPVVHREQAIRIPPAPDATASTVTARAPAQVVVRTVIVRLMSNCLRKPILKPCTQLRYAAHGEI